MINKNSIPKVIKVSFIIIPNYPPFPKRKIFQSGEMKLP